MGTPVRRLILVELKDEVGVTNHSTLNSIIIKKRGYKPFLVCHEMDDEKGDYLTKVYYRKNDTGPVYFHLYSGFSSGYWGEGSRAFIEFLTTTCGLYNREVNSEIVTKLIKTNRRYLFFLDEDNKDIFYAHISKRNIRKCTQGGRKVKLISTTPRVIKSWDRELGLNHLSS